MKPIEQTQSFVGMKALGVPPKTAKRKAADTRRGWWFVGIGATCAIIGFALIIAMTVITKAVPGIPLLVFAGLLAAPGGILIFAGGHLVAGDAMRAAEKSGGLLSRSAARALNLARTKGTL